MHITKNVREVILLHAPANGSSSSLSFETHALASGCVRTMGGQIDDPLVSINEGDPLPSSP
jgi:hypothetical protein